MAKSVSIHTLGCKLNYSESSTIAKQLVNIGLDLKQYGEKSDIFVLNTCTVTASADKECRQIIRSVIRKNPDTFVVVTGCYAQLKPEEIASINGVDLVIGSNEKFKITEYLQNVLEGNLSCAGQESKPGIFVSPLSELTVLGEGLTEDTDARTRAFLKIQDGCDYTCSYCTIPFARGGSRSLPVTKVIENAKKIVADGYKEIVLTGVNVGDYNFEGNKLIDVLYKLEKTDIERIRISSIEPNLLSDEIIELVAGSEKFCNHFHIPLQSGDREILRLMQRRYKLESYEKLIYKIKEKISDCGIGVDVIVGFPGETDERFENTFNFLSSLPVTYLHTFSYSERDNTKASKMENKVPVRKIKERSRILRNLSMRKKADFWSESIGTEHQVLFETLKNYTKMEIEGWTENYIRVKTGYKDGIENSIKNVKLIIPDGTKPVECEIIS